MSIRFIQHQFDLPADWASYLINGDATSFDLYEDGDEQIAGIDKFIEDTGLGDAVEVSPETFFLKYHDAQNYGVLPCTCATYTFLEQVDDLQPDPSLSAADRNPSMLR